MNITEVYESPFEMWNDSLNVVSLKDAKYLKSKGFNKKCFFYYLDIDMPGLEKGLKGMKWRVGTHPMNHNKYNDFIYSAPLKSVALSWVKKNKLEYALED